MLPHIAKITNEIHQVGGYGLTAPNDASIYLIHYDGHAALVDAGCGKAQDNCALTFCPWACRWNRSSICS